MKHTKKSLLKIPGEVDDAVRATPKDFDEFESV